MNLPINTGVNVHRMDLINKYRGYSNGEFNHNYNWFDGATPALCRESPCDANGHGSLEQFWDPIMLIILLHLPKLMGNNQTLRKVLISFQIHGVQLLIFQNI